jgi:hypothetical protein
MTWKIWFKVLELQGLVLGYKKNLNIVMQGENNQKYIPLSISASNYFKLPASEIVGK